MLPCLWIIQHRMMVRKVCAYMILAVVFYLRPTASSDSAGIVCREVQHSTIDFEVVFRFNRKSDLTITGLIFYTASENPNFETTVQDAGCSTNLHDVNIFTLTLSVDVDGSLPCGIQQNTSSPSIYHFAIGTVGKPQVFTFECDVNNLQIPSHVQQTNFYTEHLQTTGTFLKTKGDETSFEVLYGDDRSIPSNSEVLLGEYIKLRFSYKAYPLQTAMDSFLAQSGLLGRSFHTAVARPDSTTFVSATLRVYTLSDIGTDVHVTGQGLTTVDRFVSRANSVDIAIPRIRLSGVSSQTSWLIESKALKIVSDDADVWVELRVSYSDSALSVIIVHPDPVIGRNYRLTTHLDSNNLAPVYAVIVGTADNTQITLTLPDPYPLGALEIDGIPVGAQATYTLYLDEGKTLALYCDFSTSRLIGLTATEKVAFLYSDNKNKALQISAEHNANTDILLVRDDVKRPSVTGFYSKDFTSQFQITSELSQTTFTDRQTVTLSGSLPATYRLSPQLLTVSDVLASGISDVSPIVVPGADQWSNNYLFHFEGDTTVAFYVGGTNQSLQGVTVSNEGSVQTLLDYLPFVTAQGQTNPGIYGLDVYEQFIFQVNLTSGGQVRFNGADPFLVYAAVLVSSNQLYSVIPLGYRYKCVDENDGLSVCERPNTVIVPVSVNHLLLSGEPTFVSPKSVHENGCNVQPNTYLRYIQQFTRNPDFNETWVMDTAPFRAFRLVGYDYLYFRLSFKYCLLGFTNCINSCDAGAGVTKRSLETSNIDVKIKIKGRRRRKPCSDLRRYYWLPHVILFLIIVIQVVFIVYMLIIKWRLSLDSRR